jgi:HJR/Mrr/RecB family endonuclease
MDDTETQGVDSSIFIDNKQDIIDYLSIIISQVREHLEVLSLKQEQLVYQDDYGNWITDAWDREFTYFVSKSIVPYLAQRFGWGDERLCLVSNIPRFAKWAGTINGEEMNPEYVLLNEKFLEYYLDDVCADWRKELFRISPTDMATHIYGMLIWLPCDGPSSFISDDLNDRLEYIESGAETIASGLYSFYSCNQSAQEIEALNRESEARIRETLKEFGITTQAQGLEELKKEFETVFEEKIKEFDEWFKAGEEHFREFEVQFKDIEEQFQEASATRESVKERFDNLDTTYDIDKFNENERAEYERTTAIVIDMEATYKKTKAIYEKAKTRYEEEKAGYEEAKETKALREGQKGVASGEHSSLDTQDPIQYEKRVKEILTIAGFEAKTTKKTGDYGVDIVATKDGRKYIFQCKLYSKPVGLSAVQEVNTGRNFYKADVAIVITNKTFTPAARRLANSSNVELISYSRLREWIVANAPE